MLRYQLVLPLRVASVRGRLVFCYYLSFWHVGVPLRIDGALFDSSCCAVGASLTDTEDDCEAAVCLCVCVFVCGWVELLCVASKATC